MSQKFLLCSVLILFCSILLNSIQSHYFPSIQTKLELLRQNYDLLIEGHRDEILSYSYKDNILFTGSKDESIRIWDLHSNKQIGIFEGHTSGVSALEVSNNGEFLVSGSWDNTIRVWSITTQRQIFTLRGHTDWITELKITKDDKFIISVSRDKSLKIWNIKDQICEKTLTGHKSYIWTLDVSDSMEYAVTGSADRNIIVWDLQKLEQKFVLKGHTDYVTSISISKDSSFVISGSRDKTIKLWNLNTGKEIHELSDHNKWINFLKIGPDNLAVSASRDKDVNFWDLKSKKLIEKFVVNDEDDFIFIFFITNDLKKLFFENGKGLQVFDLEKKRKEKTLFSHNLIQEVVVTSDEKFVVARHEDNSTYVWNIDKSGENTIEEFEKENWMKKYPELNSIFNF